MPTQADFNKVNEAIIRPLCHLFRAEMNEYATDAMVEDLARFPEDTLQKALVNLRQNRKSMPAIAHIIEACNFVTPQEGVTGIPKFKPDHTALADRAMQSEEGQQALREGFGHSIWLHVRDTGEFPVTRETMAKMRRGNVDSKAAYRTLSPSIDHHMRLISLYETMEKREAEWQQKYLRRAA